MSSSRQPGFSLIEVLVSLIVICIGVLGMAALQSRSLVQSQDSVLRNTAIMLAGDLIEMMRSNPDGALNGDLFSVTSKYYKAAGSDFATTALDSADGSCAKLARGVGGDAIAGKDLTCWLRQVKALLPVTDDLIKANFAVCPSLAAPVVGSTTPYSACGSANSSVAMVVLAWQDASGNTQGCAGGICYYVLRAEL